MKLAQQSSAAHSLICLALKALCLALCCVNTGSYVHAQNRATEPFQTDVQGLVRRSDLVLQRPNAAPEQAMPLGNGQLGAAVWTANGLTIQLNRADSLPNRLSSGQVVIPGLARLTGAKDFAARLDMYDGEYRAKGGGMDATVFLDKSVDVLEVDVRGADPAQQQTVQLQLWQPRHPEITTLASLGVLAETWKDVGQDGASGLTFGTLAAITAEGRDLHIEQSSPVAISLSFRPRPDGSFRLLVGAPEWKGGAAPEAATSLLTHAASLPLADHLDFWYGFWRRVMPMKLQSLDGAAEYFENLRIVDLYTAAGESLGPSPGSQAGIGDLYSSIGDRHNWGPADYWHWNLRMQVAASLGAGVPELNASYFRLYRDNLPALLTWTKQHMGGRAGICIPETMRFNGKGYENETWLQGPAPINCGEDSKPYYNARTLSTGAEVSLWIWQQFQQTGDLAFLRENYPVMRESARFLLAYATHDNAGMLHTFPANAHENQWDVHDPLPDIAAMRELFPAIGSAAEQLGIDGELVVQMRYAAKHLPPFPLVSLRDVHNLLPAGVHADDSILAESYDPAANVHNVENDGLEPVWPYGSIGDDGPLHAAAVRTFLNRRNKWEADWSFDPLQAARLGLPEQVEAGLWGLTERYQAYPSGMAKFEGPEFYVEQIGVVTAALQDALAQDYDGLLRLAPAWPANWNAEAVVALGQGGRVRLQIQTGRLRRAAIDPGRATRLRVRNPWPGKAVNVFRAASPDHSILTSNESLLTFAVQAGAVYVLQPASEGERSLPFPAMSGAPASIAKKLGDRTLGLPPARPY
ncbi:MAG: glycosyl hydrolase family 95 catalytic domain-containing protein [Janthinobacterium lividum]